MLFENANDLHLKSRYIQDSRYLDLSTIVNEWMNEKFILLRSTSATPKSTPC